jgi:hypothetical protein
MASFLIPIVGFVIFFKNKNKKRKKANGALALGSLSLLINLIIMFKLVSNFR